MEKKKIPLWVKILILVLFGGILVIISVLTDSDLSVFGDLIPFGDDDDEDKDENDDTVDEVSGMIDDTSDYTES